MDEFSKTIVVVNDSDEDSDFFIPSNNKGKSTFTAFPARKNWKPAMAPTKSFSTLFDDDSSDDICKTDLKVFDSSSPPSVTVATLPSDSKKKPEKIAEKTSVSPFKAFEDPRPIAVPARPIDIAKGMHASKCAESHDSVFKPSSVKEQETKPAATKPKKDLMEVETDLKAIIAKNQETVLVSLHSRLDNAFKNQEKVAIEIRESFQSLEEALYKKITEDIKRYIEARPAPSESADSDIDMHDASTNALKRKIDDLVSSVEEAEKRIKVCAEPRKKAEPRPRRSAIGTVMWTLSSMVLGGAISLGLVSQM
ncbi:hypothetical protein HDU97_009065 [Phlyctochytrium planicorne]|nr:hypothetical protein HDU97_009065 [Phlyctochytrium planicorne]